MDTMDFSCMTSIFCKGFLTLVSVQLHLWLYVIVGLTPLICVFLYVYFLKFIYWNWYPNLPVYFGCGLTGVLTNDLLNWIDPFNILLKLGCELCLILLLMRDWCMLVCGLNLFCEIGPKTMLGLDVLWFADLLRWVKWQSQITINYFREVNSSVAYW